MKIKALPILGLKVGPEDGLEDGEFIVYPSTFTKEPDAYGDIIAPGAFSETIKEWLESGNTMPGLYGHRMDDPDFFVAGASEMIEDERGWRVRGKFDMDSPKGPQVYRLVKGRRLNQLSFAYEVRDEGQIKLEDGTKVNELRDVKVYEFSFVPVGANQDTSVVAVKELAESIKAGRTISAKNETSLREARDAIDSVLSQLSDDGEDQGKASATPGSSEDANGEAGDGKPSVSEEDAQKDASAVSLAAQFQFYRTTLV